MEALHRKMGSAHRRRDIACILEQAPPAIRAQQALQPAHTNLEQAILNYLGMTRFLHAGSNRAGPQPMDIGAASKRGGRSSDGRFKKRGSNKGDGRRCKGIDEY